MKSTLLHAIIIALKVISTVLVVTIGLFFISLIILIPAYSNFKTAYSSGMAGKNALTASVSQLKSQNWDEALANSQLADAKFNDALNNLDKTKSNILIKKIPVFLSQVNDLEYLFQTTEILSRSLTNSIPLARQLDEMRRGGGNFNNLGSEQKAEFLKLIYESEPELAGLKANLDIALININKIHKIGVLWPFYPKISEYKSQLQEADDLISKLIPLSKLLPALGGYPNGSDFLILLQNNDELRPTGGFIGVYGLAQTNNGEIVSISTNDSYHLDMPAMDKWRKEPPVPLKKYLKVENWYLRDANWVPDWPLAAQKINEIYAGESQAIGQTAPDFTAIIAINPDFIIDLLRLVGPINVKGENYTADNFQELLQYNVEIAYKDRNISSWDRKEIINELLEELKNRLFNLPSKDWGALLTAIENNTAEKNIQLYFKNSNLQNLVKEMGASGEVKKDNASDFFMVVDANLAAFKSDAVVKKKISYDLNQRNGAATASLTLNYRHEGDFNWRTTRYRSYTRVYVPYGSRLATYSGLDQDTADWSVLDDPILNKTIYGFFVSIEPGTEREISIHYTLPDSINQQLNNNTYYLLAQKQSGRRTQELKVNINKQGAANKSFNGGFETDKIFK